MSETRIDLRTSADEQPITALSTLQFSSGGLFDSVPVDGLAVHLVRSTRSGTPGPTLCDIDRFAKGGAGWSVGGGITIPDVINPVCEPCGKAAHAEFPGLPVNGLGAPQMRAYLVMLSTPTEV